MTISLLAIPLIPFFMAMCSLHSGVDRFMRPFYALASLPAFLTVILNDMTLPVHVDGFLLGASLGLDEIGRGFLVLTAAIWIFSGLFALGTLYAPDHGKRFWPFYLLTLGGNLGAVIAQDVVTFYVFFSIMTVAAYGLVNHARTPGSASAGRYYLTFALFGEMLVFSGIVLGVAEANGTTFPAFQESAAQSPLSPWIMSLLFVGFGIKAGLVPFHTWLPRSYFAAPMAAVAILSGTMSKAGVLAWLRHLPLGQPALETLALVFLTLAILTAFYGALVGLVQTRARTALAFSSLSQMGYIGIIAAVGLMPGADTVAVFTATMAFSFHHAFTKAALFFSVDLLNASASRGRVRWLILVAAAFCSASLIGLPLTSGAFSKDLLKELPGSPWVSIAKIVMTLGGAATALLMARFLVLAWRQTPGEQSPKPLAWIVWSALVTLCVAGGLFLPWSLGRAGFIAPPSDNLSALKSSVLVLLVFGLTAYLLRGVLLKDTALTPRPLDVVIGPTQKAFGTDLPRWITYKVDVLGHTTRRWVDGLRLEERAAYVVSRARALRMSWATGVTLFLSIWLVLWLLLAGGAP